MKPLRLWNRILTFLLLVVACAVAGCVGTSDEQVVVYSALDREFSEPILGDFHKETGITVRSNFDIESTKTVGLVNRIIQEQYRPQCDLFWNNEILHTLRLEKLGLLDVYVTPAADNIPESYRSPEGHWYGFASRARVLIVNTKLLPNEAEWPRSIHDLTDPKWKGKVAIAKPLFGTTATHAAVLFAEWGDERAKTFFHALKENADVLSGNKQVALAVGRGQYAFGLTDTDDAIIEQDNGRPVVIVPPDQGEDGIGTLFIPNTLCLIKGSPNGEHARRLVDYLLQPEIETRLANGRSAQFPVNPTVKTKSRADFGRPVKWMTVDFHAAADKWETAAEFLKNEFSGAE